MDLLCKSLEIIRFHKNYIQITDMKRRNMNLYVEASEEKWVNSENH